MKDTKKKLCEGSEVEQFPWLSVTFSVLMLIVVTAFFVVFPIESAVLGIQKLVSQSGLLAPLLFVLVFIVTVVVPPLPERPLILSAGLLFHPLLGALLSITGATLGAGINFLLARKFGSKLKFVRFGRVENLLTKFEPLGTLGAIIMIRTFAGFTFDWYSYLVGFLKTRLSVYLFGTVIGITTGTTIEVYAGSYLLKNPYVTLIVGLVSICISVIAYKAFPKLRSYVNKLESIFPNMN